MTRAEELIKDREIADFLATHQNVAKAVRDAADVLANEPDAKAALSKVLPALSDKVVKVFFSYKSKDKCAAELIVKVLKDNAADKLQITFQGEFTAEIAGRQYRQHIRERVRQANWFILLLPDPSDELDWCLYETGQFEAQHTSADRLICLHHPDTALPSQVDGYHAVSATTPQMQSFLRLVFVQPNPVPGLAPINRGLEAQIPKLAEQLVDAIRAPKRKVHRDIFVPCIGFRLEEAKTLTSKEGLDSATIVEANKEALELFGFLHVRPTFGELRSSIAEGHGDGRWREELFQVIRNIAQGRTFRPDPGRAAVAQQQDVPAGRVRRRSGR